MLILEQHNIWHFSVAIHETFIVEKNKDPLAFPRAKSSDSPQNLMGSRTIPWCTESTQTVSLHQEQNLQQKGQTIGKWNSANGDDCPGTFTTVIAHNGTWKKCILLGWLRMAKRKIFGPKSRSQTVERAALGPCATAERKIFTNLTWPIFRSYMTTWLFVCFLFQ